MFEAFPITSSHSSVLTVLPLQMDLAGKSRGLQSQTTGGCLHLKKEFMHMYVWVAKNSGSVQVYEDATRLWESLSPCWNSPQNPWYQSKEQGIKLVMPGLAADAPAEISSLEMLSLGFSLLLPPWWSAGSLSSRKRRRKTRRAVRQCLLFWGFYSTCACSLSFLPHPSLQKDPTVCAVWSHSSPMAPTSLSEERSYMSLQL